MGSLVASLLEKTPAKRPETAEAVIGRVEKDAMPALTVAASIPPPPPPPPPPPSHTPPPRPRGITRMLEALRDDDVTPKQ